MDCDATCLLLGPAGPLLNLIGFLVFSAFVLCGTNGSAGGGRREPHLWADAASVALTRGA